MLAVIDRSLDAHYERMSNLYQVDDAPEYGPLVVPTGNSIAPVHRWFTVKEGYSAGLLERIKKDIDFKGNSATVADAFTGAGTTLISTLLDESLTKRHAVGTEINPFLHFVASTKVNSVLKPPRDLERLLDFVADAPLGGRLHAPPALHAFHQTEYWPGTSLADLTQLRTHLASWRGSAGTKALGLLALLAAAEPASALRRDGRALRYVPDKPRVSVRSLMLRTLENMMADIEHVKQVGGELSATVALGDGRRLAEQRWKNADLVLCSPPYPNNIDYTEVYKLEGWLYGAYADEKAFRAQREATMRSHPSITFPDRAVASAHRDAVDAFTTPILDAVPNDRYQRARQQMIAGYCADLIEFLDGARATVRKGGNVVVVVGNSAHGPADEAFVVAADLAVAELGRAVGLECTRIAVARYPRRRKVDHPLLRESVVFLKRPNAARAQTGASQR